MAPVAASAASAASFSTTSGHYAKKGAQHIRAGKITQVRKKKAVPPRGKAPAPGERKAMRKRIVLSNNNALEVPGLEELTAEHLVGASPESVGKVYALPDALVDRLRIVEAFKPTQAFPLFRRPSVLVRRETIEVATRLQQAAEAGQTLRLVVDGERIAGKSILLLQAMSHGFLNNWVVINVPEAQELTTACTEYAPLADTEPTQYVQPVYVLKLLQRLLAANAGVLAKYKTVRGYETLQNPVAAGSTLQQLVAAAKENDHAWPVFRALWAELTDPALLAEAKKQELARPPVLLALDGLAHLMRVSDYRSAAYEPIHAHDLALVRVLADVLSGATPLPRGGGVVAVTTRGNAPLSPSMELALKQRLAEQSGDKAAAPSKDAYFRGYDERVAATLQSVQVLPLRGVAKDEARALMEYWAASGILRERIDEQSVAGAWSLAGNGVVGELERASLLTIRP